MYKSATTILNRHKWSVEGKAVSVVCKSPLDDRLTQTEDWQATITLMCTIKHQNVVQLCGFTAFPGSMVRAVGRSLPPQRRVNSISPAHLRVRPTGVHRTVRAGELTESEKYPPAKYPPEQHSRSF